MCGTFFGIDEADRLVVEVRMVVELAGEKLTAAARTDD